MLNPVRREGSVVRTRSPKRKRNLCKDQGKVKSRAAGLGWLWIPGQPGLNSETYLGKLQNNKR